MEFVEHRLCWSVRMSRCTAFTPFVLQLNASMLEGLNALVWSGRLSLIDR